MEFWLVEADTGKQIIRDIERYLVIYTALKLPVRLKKTYLEDKSYDKLLEIGKSTTKEIKTMINMALTVTPEDVVRASRADGVDVRHL